MEQTNELPIDPTMNTDGSAKTVEEVEAEMQKWKDEALVNPKFEKRREIISQIEPKDLEAHGFTLQTRNKSTDPFIYRKWVMIGEMRDRNWDEHGYCVQIVMLMPMGKTFIKMMGPEHVYFPDKAVPKAEELPCHFDGVLLTAAELDNVLEMCFKRDSIFDFNPELPVPHQNFWVDVARNIITTQPKVN